MSSSTSDKNNSNESSAATTPNKPLTKSDNEIASEEQSDDSDLECYQEDGIDADFYEDEDRLPTLSKEERLERIEDYRKNRNLCPHSLLEVYKGTVVGTSKELKENLQKLVQNK